MWHGHETEMSRKPGPWHSGNNEARPSLSRSAGLRCVESQGVAGTSGDSAIRNTNAS